MKILTYSIISCFILYFLNLNTLQANIHKKDSLPDKVGFFTPSPTFNKARFWTLTGSISTAYAATVVGLNQVWYANYPRSNFHFFNDWHGWRKMDKMGHAFTAYFESKLICDLYRWSGVDSSNSAIIGAGAGLIFQGSLEILDAYSTEWGFSIGDVAFNTLGASLFLAQELFWKEQRIRLKLGFHLPKYSSTPIKAINSDEYTTLADRAHSLYGSSVTSILKEYNGQTIWASVNIASFLNNKPKYLPSWLNVAVGYGIENIYGADHNWWTNKNGSIFVADPIQYPRLSQYYFSLDIDFERIKTNKKWLKTVFKILNVFKLPFPTLELNSKGDFRFRALYF